MASRVEALKLTPRKNQKIPLQCLTSGAFFIKSSEHSCQKVSESCSRLLDRPGMTESESKPQLRTPSSCTAMAGSQSSSYTGRYHVPNLSKNEWKDLDRELKPILAPWHEHLAIATSQNISEKLCHSHLCTLSWGALAVRSRAHVCKILLNSNMLRLTYPVEHEFETARLPPST